jgi:hypothetical protein
LRSLFGITPFASSLEVIWLIGCKKTTAFKSSRNASDKKSLHYLIYRLAVFLRLARAKVVQKEKQHGSMAKCASSIGIRQ